MHLPSHAFIRVQSHEIHVTQWGDTAKPPLVLWHGLVRTCRDFDELAQGLSHNYFVICPDTIGRGLSSWAKHPEKEYALSHYCKLAIGLLDHYGITQTSWIGTSMGGLIGMALAAGDHASRLHCLVMNDIGPEIPQAALDRIRSYISSGPPQFNSLAEAESTFRLIYTTFGPVSDLFWNRLVRHSTRRNDAGKITMHFDPKIVEYFPTTAKDYDCWDLYNSIKVPTHIIWGEKSDVLTKDILERMKQSGPKPGVSVFQDCGHAPSLSRKEDIALVSDRLKQLTNVQPNKKSPHYT